MTDTERRAFAAGRSIVTDHRTGETVVATPHDRNLADWLEVGSRVRAHEASEALQRWHQLSK